MEKNRTTWRLLATRSGWFAAHSGRYARVLMRIAFCIILLTALIGCFKNPSPFEDGYYYLSGARDPGVDIYVNGNPTAGGHALSLFVIQGANTADFRGTFDTGFIVRIVKAKSIFDNNPRIVVDANRNATEAALNPKLTFDEPNWPRWKWQDGEELKSLTDHDKDELFAILDDYCGEVASEAFNPRALFEKSYVEWWSYDNVRNHDTMEHSLDMSKKLPVRDKLIFERALKGDIEFLTGTRLVMMKTKGGGKLLWLGPKEDEKRPPVGNEVKVSYFVEMEEMFFIKLNGKWKLLMPIN